MPIITMEELEAYIEACEAHVIALDNYKALQLDDSIDIGSNPLPPPPPPPGN